MGNNGGTAFVRINGKRIYLGKFGSAEAAQNYARCVAEWVINGTSPEQSAQTIGTITVPKKRLRRIASAERLRGRQGLYTSKIGCPRNAVFAA